MVDWSNNYWVKKRCKQPTWAWSVIPMVAIEPSCLTHSCESAYLSPSKTAKQAKKHEQLKWIRPLLLHANWYRKILGNIWTWYFIYIYYEHMNIPVDKHLEKEKGGKRWGLEAEESLSALAVEEAHILSAIRDWGCACFSTLVLSVLVMYVVGTIILSLKRWDRWCSSYMFS